MPEGHHEAESVTHYPRATVCARPFPDGPANLAEAICPTVYGVRVSCSSETKGLAGTVLSTVPHFLHPSSRDLLSLSLLGLTLAPQSCA